jgi:CBS domain-containing protein
MSTDERPTGDHVSDDTGPTGAGVSDETRIADIMERNVVTIGPEATIHDLVKLLQEKDLGGVPVVDDDRHVLGMVTEGDLVIEEADVRMPHFFQLFGTVVSLGSQKKFKERAGKMLAQTVGEVMTKEVFTVRPDDVPGRAATLMSDNKIDRLPVVDDDERLVGIVARHDIIRMLGL